MEKDTLELIRSDFNQCYQQLRHHDTQIIDVFKFLFTAYTAVIGVSYGLYQFSIKEKLILLIPSISILSIALLLGLFILFLIIKNRIYFVKLARYINSIRKHFTDFKDVPDYLKNFYNNINYPKFLDLFSSQLILIYFISVSNSFLLFSILYFIKIGLLSSLIFCFIALIIQLLIVIIILLNKEKDLK